MAFTVNEIAAGEATRGIGESSYRRAWRVESDSVVRPQQAAAAAPVIVGSLYPWDQGARCSKVTATWERERDSMQVYRVVATYDTPSGGAQEEVNENPLDDRPVISWGSRTVRLPVRYTNDQPPRPIANSAGEPFDPLPEEDFKVLVYTYQHNIAVYNEANASKYRGAINSDTFTLAGLDLVPFRARIASITANNGERNGVRFWTERVVVEIVDDWRLTLVDEGLRADAPGGGPDGEEVYLGNAEFRFIAPVRDAEGIPIERPVLLDGFGNVLRGGDPVLLQFSTRAKPELPFAPLGLPTTNEP